MHAGSQRAIRAALLANVGIAAAKAMGFVVTGAASLLAETVHSVADSANQLLLLFGAARANRPPTPEHPFGYGRERYFWAFVVAVVLFTLGGLFALSEGIEKLRHPVGLEHPSLAVGILLVGIFLEGMSFRTAVREASALRGAESWWAFIRHAKSPELPVVLLEDLAALVGLTVALACIGLTAVTGDPRFDAAGSLLIGVLLGAVAMLLAAEMKSLLIGESASRFEQREIRAALESHAALRRLVHLRTQHLGPEELLVGAKIELDESLTLVEATDVIDELERRIRARVPSARVIYLDPDVARS